MAYRLAGRAAPVDEPEPERMARPRIPEGHAVTA
jgi:hypothetical protein